MRQFIEEYISTESALIEEWLGGDGSLESVGEQLILLSLERYRSNGTLNLYGIAGPYVEFLFCYAPGGPAARLI